MTSPEPTPPTNMMMAALWWATKNINVIPLHYPRDGQCSCGHNNCASPAKHPIAKLVPRGLSDATTNPTIIKDWWMQEPYANIGVRTGETFDLLDIDTAAGADTLRELATQHGGMPTNLGHARSGRDGAGIHIYTVPGGQKALTGGRTAPPGIDVKGRGGYAVVPPSMHITGRRYTWIDNRFDTAEIIGDLPWPDFYRHLETRPPQQPPRAPKPATQIPADAATAYGRAVLRRATELVHTTHQGHRWQTLATEAIPLVARGIDGGCIDRDSGIRELEDAARTVGLEPKEISRIPGLIDQMIDAGIRHPLRPKEAAAATLYATEQEARTDPWEPPWPLRHPTPPFPIDVLGWIAPAVKKLATQLQVPVDLVAMMTIATVAATIRGRIRAKVINNWEEPLNLYIATVLGPGETKSPALARIVAPLRDMENRARADAKRTITERQFAKDLADERARRLRDKALKASGPDHEVMLTKHDAWQAADQAEAIQVPTMPLWLAGDMTPEALVAKLAEQAGALAHISAEGELLDTIVGGRYTSGAPHISALLTAHDGREPVRVHRKRDPDIEVPHPCLTLGLAVQPQVLEQMGKVDAAVRRGLAARFLYAVPGTLVGRRDMTLRGGADDIEDFHRLIEGVNTLASGDFGPSIRGEEERNGSRQQTEGSGDFGPSIRGEEERNEAPGAGGSGDIGPSALIYGFLPSSLLLFFHYREGLEPRRAAETGDLGEISAWANKLDGHLVRLAAILQIINDTQHTSHNYGTRAQNPHIGVGATASALILADYLIAHAVEAHAVMGSTHTSDEHDHAKQLLGWIRHQGHHEFTARDAERSLRKRITFREQGSVHRACNTLQRLGWIRRIPTDPTPGRPSVRYLVHPETHR